MLHLLKVCRLDCCRSHTSRVCSERQRISDIRICHASFFFSPLPPIPRTALRFYTALSNFSAILRRVAMSERRAGSCTTSSSIKNLAKNMSTESWTSCLSLVNTIRDRLSSYSPVSGPLKEAGVNESSKKGWIDEEETLRRRALKPVASPSDRKIQPSLRL